MDINATLNRIKELQELNKEQARQIARLKGTIALLVEQLHEASEPIAQPYYPCNLCHDTGLVREWKKDSPGVEEIQCPSGCEIKELHTAKG
jgi:hypothetical protein